MKAVNFVAALVIGAMPIWHSPAASAQSQDLGQAANDPTASLMAFQFRNFYTSSFHKLPGETQNSFDLRATIPWEIAGTSNIFRLTTPYVTHSPSGAEGFADSTLFNLTTFDQSWGRWGIGAVALLPSWETGLSTRKYGLGPAVGFTAQANWGLWGLFNQNVFSIGGDSDARDVNLSTFQAILNVPLGNDWSLGASEMTFVYDWDAGEFTSIPLGLKLSKLTKPGRGRIPVQYQLSYEHNFYDDAPGPRDVWGLTVKLLVPK